MLTGLCTVIPQLFDVIVPHIIMEFAALKRLSLCPPLDLGVEVIPVFVLYLQ